MHLPRIILKVFDNNLFHLLENVVRHDIIKKYLP